MAIIEHEPSSLPELESGAASVAADRGIGILARPTDNTGWRSWLFTVDHKKLGIMYGTLAMVWFLVGGIEALLVRLQLATPNGTILSADAYNQAFTMHGTTMVFLVVMPLAAAFANYVIPLQIGARDVAFPRMNALGLWLFAFGGIFLNLSWFTGGGADCGWFCYTPNSGLTFSPGNGVDYYALGLLITGVASLVGSVNLIITILNMRAPGMDLRNMPIFCWMILVVQFLLLFSLPVITVALLFLVFDRNFGSHFFNAEMGADPLLWQHLFWIFGHPEVYIVVLPSFGIISETLPVFSRKPLFGYSFVVFSGIAIAFLGFGVWAHHMFASGMGPVSVAAFSAATMFIAVPTGVKVLNWVATMWGGNLRFTTAMLFSISLVSMFTIGGVTGVMHSVAASDTQQTDSYFIVAHFHYTLFGGGVTGLFAGVYYWWPKAFGFLLDEKLGKIHFWLMLSGFNLTFMPLHFVGLQGMARRTYRYDEGLGYDFTNMLATGGTILLFISAGVFMWNIWTTTRKYKSGEVPQAGADPWDGRTLEWSIPSPAPEHNFDYNPVVTELDDWWHKKYQKDENGNLVKIADGNEIAQKGDQHPHLPSPSYWPIVLAAGVPVLCLGVIYNLWLCLIGGLVVVAAVYGWALEPATDPNAGHHGDDHDSPEGDDSDAAANEEASID